MKRWAIAASAFVLVSYALLLIPDSDSSIDLAAAGGAAQKSFAWNQDAYWSRLEAQFVEAREIGCETIRFRVDSSMLVARKMLDTIRGLQLSPDEKIFGRLEKCTFDLGSLIAACPEQSPSYQRFVEDTRTAVKKQSEHWDMDRTETRETLYRLIYGGRAAVEEIMLQLPQGSAPDPLSIGADEPSQTPSASILGTTIHSGDILVSRGGAPTSALIARGNDLPGNFSHVALVYVDPKTHLVSILESHIERGAVISTLDEYMKDLKLRVMVLRLRSTLPPMQHDPLLPHRAAEFALERIRHQHIPYDFAMDFQNPDKWFCAEVASFAYKNVGVQLWMGLSRISSPGLRSWLAAFGVRHFETQEPSDLEYDPQLRVVAEWRDPETLRKDHLDNAVTEAMLEGAEAGDRLTYAWYLLPVGRIVKTYSIMLNLLGKVGPIPEGMSPGAALRSNEYSSKHARMNQELARQAQKFQTEKGYAPPYWELIKMARMSKRTIESQ